MVSNHCLITYRCLRVRGDAQGCHGLTKGLETYILVYVWIESSAIASLPRVQAGQFELRSLFDPHELSGAPPRNTLVLSSGQRARYPMSQYLVRLAHSRVPGLWWHGLDAPLTQL